MHEECWAETVRSGEAWGKLDLICLYWVTAVPWQPLVTVKDGVARSTSPREGENPDFYVHFRNFSMLVTNAKFPNSAT